MLTATNGAKRAQDPLLLALQNDFKLLGEPPLLAKEDPQQYMALLLEIARSVQPVDFIERLYTHDVAYLTWEIIRLRGIKAAILDFTNSPNDQKSQQEAAGLTPKRRRKPSALAALSFVVNGSSLQAAEAMIASAQMRRGNLLQDIEERQARLGRDLRRSSDRVLEEQRVTRLAAPSIAPQTA